MKKIILIGCPGGGKSTFARKLHALTGFPLVHLDALYWNPDGTHVSREAFVSRLETALAGEAWIADGNYGGTVEDRIRRCDTVFLFDLPADVCLAGIAARRGKPRSDLPWVETVPDAEFEAYVRAFSQQQTPRLRELLARYPQKQVIVFSSRAEADAWIAAFHSVKFL